MRNQNGFTLLEVLVTLLIVSLGLLGIAGIIANSLKSNHGAYFRTQASVLANDIIDRMRADRAEAELATLPYNIAMSAAPSGSGNPFNDLTSWRTTLAANLPSGNGSVNLDSTTKKVTVSVQWDDSRAAGVSSTTQVFTVETRL
ncbi:MAG: type IV pilus modification protein PilV [Thiobacillaceae bacterium]